MQRPATATYPLSYSQPCDTFRPRRTVFRSARRAGLGRTAFAHFLERGSVRDRFVAELVPKGRPGYVIDAFRHPGFGELHGRHIADRDVIEPAHQIERELVLEVGASMGDFGMQLRYLPLFVRPLRLRQSLNGLASKSVVGNRLAGGQPGKVFQAQVDPDAGMDRPGLNIGHLNHDVQKPVAARILGKVGAVLDLAIRQRARVKHAERVPGKTEGDTFALQVAPLQRHPTEGFLAAIAQPRAAALAARLRVLLARCVDRTGVNPQFLAAAGGQHVQIEPARPLLAPFERVLLRIVAVVPDVIHRAALLVQQAVQGFYAVTVDQNHAGHFNAELPPCGGAPFLPGLNTGVSRSR